MMIRNGLFTSESVSEGHPDKLADRISDAIVDAFLTLDPNARVACETLLADQFVVVAGEFKATPESVFASVKSRAEAIVRDVIRLTGYTDAASGIDPDQCEIDIRFNDQSSDINQGVDRSDGVLGAGDQGLMFGFACDETPELMPAPIVYAHRLVRKQAELRQSGALPWLRPDAKSQVSFRYENGRPVAIEAVVLSTQHEDGISLEQVRADVSRLIIAPVIPLSLRAAIYRELINPTGRFVTGGPKGDTGLTGRKIIVDTYGGSAPHGGGAFSGKDPSKVDRSAAYMARYLAKQVVARAWATRCLVQLSYAIGVPEPVSFLVETCGTGALTSEQIAARLDNEFDLTPAGIIEHLQLKRSIYFNTAAYGHFGRTDVAFPWEATTTKHQVCETLQAAYQGTSYEVTTPEQTFAIRIGETCPAVDALLHKHNQTRWACVTAWNPRSRALSAEDNAKRQSDLRALLQASGFTVYPGRGVPADVSWEAEESFLILGIKHHTAKHLGTRLEQNAIVVGEVGEPALLVMCDLPEEETVAPEAMA